MMNTPDFGPLQANHLYYGQASPSSPLLHHILQQQQQQQHTAPSQDQHHQQQEQKDDRTRFVMRLAILLQRLNKMAENHQHKGDSFSSCYHHPAAPSTTTINSGVTITTEEIIVKSQLLIRRVKQLVRYATQRNRLGDPRFSPLVESIEQCLADLVGCDEWFSICLEAEQRHRVRQISHTMMIVSSTMMLGSSNNNNNNSNNSVLQSSSTSSSSSGVGPSGGRFKPTPNNNFPASFFP